MRRFGQFWGSSSDPLFVLKFISPGGGTNPGRLTSPALGLDHLIHVRTQQAEHQRVDQHAHLGRLALSVGDHGADQGQLAGQVIGHGVRNQEKEDEASNLRHLVLYTVKKKFRFQCNSIVC